MLRTFVWLLLIAIMANAEWIVSTTGLLSGDVSGFDAVNISLSWEEDYSSRQSISLTLKRNTGFQKMIPIYSLDKRDGKVKQMSEVKLQDTVFYQDVDKFGAISVTKTTDGRFDMRGTFTHQASQYSIEPYHPKIHKRTSEIGDHIISKLDINTPINTDYMLPEPSDEQTEILQQSNQNNNISKSPSMAAIAYEVKLFVLVDSYLYKNLSSLSRLFQWRLGPENFVAFYMGNLVNEVDIRYRGIDNDILNISTKLSYLHIAKSEAENPYSEDKVNEQLQAAAEEIIVDLTNWVTENKAYLPIYAAHYMLQTGLDLAVNGSIRNRGYSRLGEACRDSPVSVCEYSLTNTAAHELGHSLGANHDGDGNDCNGNDLYVMAPSSDYTSGNTIGNRWKFSSCSVKSIQSYIQNLTKQGKNCLFNKESIIAWDNNSTEKLGQIVSSDLQCQIVFGNEFSFLGGIKYKETMCNKLRCISSINGSVLSRGGALQYTSCGDKQWCDRERCVYDANAPSADPDCPLGDKKGLIYTKVNKTCAMITGYDCYNDTIKTTCCASCQRLKTGPAGCEYGDKDGRCASQTYPYTCNNLSATCCASCGTYSTPWLGDGCPYGDKAHWCVNMAIRDCPLNGHSSTCCQKCCKDNCAPLISSATKLSIKLTINFCFIYALKTVFMLL